MNLMGAALAAEELFKRAAYRYPKGDSPAFAVRSLQPPNRCDARQLKIITRRWFCVLR
jgi:hypothetical protein